MESTSKIDEAFKIPAEAIRQLYKTGSFSDIEIHCNEKVFKVHKCIISSQGGYFAPDKGGFAGGDSKLEIHDEDPHELGAVLKYLYGIQYSVPDGLESAASFHAGVYARAKYFQLPVALENFKAVAHTNGIEGAHFAFLAAKRVYDDNNDEDMQEDRELKDILLKVLMKHKDKVLVKDAGNRIMLKDIPGLSYDLAIGLSSNGGTSKAEEESPAPIVQCRNCLRLVSLRSNCDYCGVWAS